MTFDRKAAFAQYSEEVLTAERARLIAALPEAEAELKRCDDECNRPINPQVGPMAAARAHMEIQKQVHRMRSTVASIDKELSIRAPGQP